MIWLSFSAKILNFSSFSTKQWTNCLETLPMSDCNWQEIAFKRCKSIWQRYNNLKGNGTMIKYLIYSKFLSLSPWLLFFLDEHGDRAGSLKHNTPTKNGRHWERQSSVWFICMSFYFRRFKKAVWSVSPWSKFFYYDSSFGLLLIYRVMFSFQKLGIIWVWMLWVHCSIRVLWAQ